MCPIEYGIIHKIFCFILDGIEYLEMHTRTSENNLRRDLLDCCSEFGMVLTTAIEESTFLRSEMYKLIRRLLDKWIEVVNEDFNLNQNNKKMPKYHCSYNEWFDMVFFF